ncbi:MAG: hybrid sensor histidine kinase/response regulator [Magnetococcus sp. MYC-9]
MQSTILLVDDEDANLELLQGLLKDDYALVCAKNGPKALSLAAQKPDLILLDIMMPGMDGYEVCRRLKANEQTKSIPIIFVATKREMADEIDGLKIGAVDYIAKPITPMEVKARVKTYLALRPADQPQQDVPAGCSACRELNAPIGRMLNLADTLLKDATLSVEQRKPLLAIRNDGFHALSVINLSLGLAALEQGSYSVKAVNIDLLSLLRTARSQAEVLIRNKRLTLKIQLKNRTDTEKNQFLVRGDKMLCYSLLAILIKRATDASPSDQAIVVAMEDAGKSGIVRISDLGVVPVTAREQFFSKNPTAGSGLAGGQDGYVAKLLAEAQGGRIRMRTDETKGTEIVFSLPKEETGE